MEELNEFTIGTVKWFAKSGQSYGFIGYGIFTNNEYEKQVYVHYKQIKKKNQLDPKIRKLTPGDIVSFKIGPGFHVDGTQALDVEIIRNAI